MKTVAQFWPELVKLTTPWGLDNKQQREIQSLVLEGIEALPVIAIDSYEAATSTHIAYGGMSINDKFKLGAASEKELNGVKTELILITRLAIRLTTQDFTVYDGLRTLKEQQAHVKAGTSKTHNSKHLQGLAVDLVPWINGKPVWDWDGCYKIAQAFDAAATHLGYANKVRWGGAWDRMLSDFGNPDDWAAYETEVSQYHKRTGKSFVDGPHFEWVG